MFKPCYGVISRECQDQLKTGPWDRFTSRANFLIWLTSFHHHWSQAHHRRLVKDKSLSHKIVLVICLFNVSDFAWLTILVVLLLTPTIFFPKMASWCMMWPIAIIRLQADLRHFLPFLQFNGATMGRWSNKLIQRIAINL